MNDYKLSNKKREYSIAGYDRIIDYPSKPVNPRAGVSQRVYLMPLEVFLSRDLRKRLNVEEMNAAILANLELEHESTYREIVSTCKNTEEKINAIILSDLKNDYYDYKLYGYREQTVYDDVMIGIDNAILSDLKSKFLSGVVKFKTELYQIYKTKLGEYESFWCYNDQKYKKIKYFIDSIMNDKLFQVEDYFQHLLNFFNKVMDNYPAACSDHDLYLKILAKFAETNYKSYKKLVIKLGDRIFFKTNNEVIEKSWQEIKKKTEQEIKKLEEKEKKQATKDQGIYNQKEIALPAEEKSEYSIIRGQINNAIRYDLKSKWLSGVLKFSNEIELNKIYDMKVEEYQYMFHSKKMSLKTEEGLKYIMSDKVDLLGEELEFVFIFFNKLMDNYPAAYSDGYFYLEILTTLAGARELRWKKQAVKLGDRIFLKINNEAIQNSWQKTKQETEEEIKKLEEKLIEYEIRKEIANEKRKKKAILIQNIPA